MAASSLVFTNESLMTKILNNLSFSELKSSRLINTTCNDAFLELLLSGRKNLTFVLGLSLVSKTYNQIDPDVMEISDYALLKHVRIQPASNFVVKVRYDLTKTPCTCSEASYPHYHPKPQPKLKDFVEKYSVCIVRMELRNSWPFSPKLCEIIVNSYAEYPVLEEFIIRQTNNNNNMEDRCDCGNLVGNRSIEFWGKIILGRDWMWFFVMARSLRNLDIFHTWPRTRFAVPMRESKKMFVRSRYRR